MTNWLQEQLDKIKEDAETWSAWKRREVGLMPKPAPPVIRCTPVQYAGCKGT